MTFVNRKKKTRQLQEAKPKFSELIERVRAEEPQIITQYGEEIAVEISMQEYKNLQRSKTSLVDLFKESPCADVDLNITRSCDLPKDINI